MKTLDVISYFDTIRPNSFDYKTKKEWLMSVEAEIRDFAALHSGKIAEDGYLNAENPELYLDRDYRDLYAYYLASMADMTNAEYNLYNINSTYFNSLFDKWKKQHRSSVVPIVNKGVKV